MAKTACEEAAELLSDDYGIVGLSARKRLTTHPDARNKLSKRLRAEGRELRRLRKLIRAWWLTGLPKGGTVGHKRCTPDEYAEFPCLNHNYTTDAPLCREAARIQKRKAK